MTDKGNSVNIAEERPYHHGDLRAALVAAGARLLSEGSAEDLSLRAVARAVGVSATAVYRHFPDKQALLYAICAQTADGLREAQMRAMAHEKDPQAAFLAAGKAYVRFALAQPTAFRLLMSTRPPQDDKNRNVAHAMGALRKVFQAMNPGVTEAQVRVAAIHAWAHVHGLAMLMLDGQAPPDEALIESLGENAILSLNPAKALASKAKRKR